MKVKISSIYASPHMTAQPGSVIDVSDEEGKQLVAGRFGIEVAAPAAPETAMTGAPETAARRAGGRGNRSRAAAPAAPAAPETDKKE